MTGRSMVENAADLTLLDSGLLTNSAGMTWSLSEYLNRFEFRSQSWCFVDIGHGTGVRIPTRDVVYFYVVMEGEVSLHASETAELRYKAGDVVFVLSGMSHLLSFSRSSSRQTIPLLQDGGYVDDPPTVTVGQAPFDAKVLCGRLKVRWPTGKRLRGVPNLLAPASGSLNLDVLRYTESARGPGGAAILTHFANLVFVSAFRGSAECMNLFAKTSQLDPIDRARRYIELHPWHPWTVAILANKIGMSRSNFAARFADQTGKTPMQMLAVQRMNLAAELLETSNLKVTEVCERVGYRSEAAFHHRFTTHFSVPPGQFRKERRASVAKNL